MKHILFFATKDDLLPVLDAVEAAAPLKYVRGGNFTQPGLDVFNRGSEIPTLGKANSDSAGTCEAFLVCSRTVPINIESFKGAGGVDRYCVDQRLNPDTVGFTPAGQWSEEVFLHGRVATVSESPASQALMKWFGAAIKKHFVKIKAFYVGPQAKVMLDAGKRLTISAQSPREFDLALSPGK